MLVGVGTADRNHLQEAVIRSLKAMYQGAGTSGRIIAPLTSLPQKNSKNSEESSIELANLAGIKLPEPNKPQPR